MSKLLDTALPKPWSQMDNWEKFAHVLSRGFMATTTKGLDKLEDLLPNNCKLIHLEANRYCVCAMAGDCGQQLCEVRVIDALATPENPIVFYAIQIPPFSVRAA